MVSLPAFESLVRNCILPLTRIELIRITGIKHPANYMPIIKWETGQGNTERQLRAAGTAVRERPGNVRKVLPNLIVVVLPEGGNDIYTSVKQ